VHARKKRTNKLGRRARGSSAARVKSIIIVAIITDAFVFVDRRCPQETMETIRPAEHA
jgi:hypothetical protein